ncbi:fimbrial protein [Klebsiella aerogenes]
MKYLRIAIATLVLLNVKNVCSQQNVTLSLEGEFLSGTCDVTVNGGTPDALVILDKIGVNEVNSRKSVPAGKFRFTLSNCASASNTQMRPYLEGGDNIDTTNYYLKNTKGTATGVELKIVTAAGNQIKPGTETQSGWESFPSGEYETQYYTVSYETDSTIGPATAGTVQSAVVYHFEYK